MDLLERIIRQNPHWETREDETIKDLKERHLLKELLEYDRDKQMTAIVGLRRTGKTTILHQYIQHLTKEGRDPHRILYFSFDEILGRNPEIIEEILEAYEQQILKEKLAGTHILFDEINHVPDWQTLVKRYYDLNQDNKFILTGSSSIYLKKTKESLAGRIYEFTLPPLTFKEYLHLKNTEVRDPVIQSPTIKRELTNYILRGGFPEKIHEKDYQKTKKYVNTIIEKIVYYDIPKVYDVREPEALKEILALVARKPGALMEYKNLASSLKLTYQTVSKYVSYLEKAFLLKLVYNWRGSPLARARKAKKAYLTTPSLAAAFLDTEKEFHQMMPTLVENTVQNHLNANHFYRRRHEIDFLHENTPVEVKYSNKPEIKGALAAAKEIKAKKLSVVTKDTEKTETRDGVKVKYTPLWKFLLED